MWAPKIHDSVFANSVVWAICVQVAAPSLSASWVASTAAPVRPADQVGDKLDLGLDDRRDVGEATVCAEDHEHVGEARRGDAEISGGPVLPVLLNGPAAATSDVHLMVVAVDRVKSGREDQHVELVLDPVVGENTPWRNLDDRVFLGADQGYVVA